MCQINPPVPYGNFLGIALQCWLLINVYSVNKITFTFEASTICENSQLPVPYWDRLGFRNLLDFNPVMKKEKYALDNDNDNNNDNNNNNNVLS